MSNTMLWIALIVSLIGNAVIGYLFWRDDKGYKDGYKEGWNSCVRDSADGWIIDYM